MPNRHRLLEYNTDADLGDKKDFRQKTCMKAAID
jgi:hypothetical protein